MHILQQLRLLLLLVLHVSPGKAGDPMLSSQLFPVSQAGACTAVSAALQRAQTAGATRPPPPSAPRPLATASSWRSTSPTWSVSACLGSTQIYLRPQTQITFQMTLTPISVTMGRARCSSWPAPAWGRTWGTSAAPGSRRARPSPSAGQSWLMDGILIWDMRHNNINMRHDNINMRHET